MQKKPNKVHIAQSLHGFTSGMMSNHIVKVESVLVFFCRFYFDGFKMRVESHFKKQKDRPNTHGTVLMN